MNNLVLIAILALTIVSCGVREPKIILTDYYKDGKIESTMEMDKDSILNGWTKVYYPNGNLEYTAFFVNEKIEGELTRYFESGQVKTIEHYSNHKMHGQSIAFFENGKKKVLGYFYHGLQVGRYYEFYDNENNSVKLDSYWYIHGNKSRPNVTTEYSENGAIKYGSPYADFKLLDKEIEIKLQRPKFKNMRVIIGDYDYLFNLRDPNSNDTTDSRNDFTVILPFTKKDTIRGYIENWEYLTDSTGASQFIHFSYPDIWE
jgi:antitoxin component YwqK of YwqJK toxin-antitoxin module